MNEVFPIGIQAVVKQSKTDGQQVGKRQSLIPSKTNFYQKSLVVSKKRTNFALVNRWILFTDIGIWCNWQHYRFWSCHSWFESEYPNANNEPRKFFAFGVRCILHIIIYIVAGGHKKIPSMIIQSCWVFLIHINRIIPSRCLFPLQRLPQFPFPCFLCQQL